MAKAGVKPVAVEGVKAGVQAGVKVGVQAGVRTGVLAVNTEVMAEVERVVVAYGETADWMTQRQDLPARSDTR